MYLHLGQEVVIKGRDVVGIFDLEKTSVSKRTKEFLVEASHRGEAVTVSYEMPKSFILTSEKMGSKCNEMSQAEECACKENKTQCNVRTKINKVYISQISTTTLKKRSK